MTEPLTEDERLDRFVDEALAWARSPEGRASFEAQEARERRFPAYTCEVSAAGREAAVQILRVHNDVDFLRDYMSDPEHLARQLAIGRMAARRYTPVEVRALYEECRLLAHKKDLDEGELLRLHWLHVETNQHPIAMVFSMASSIRSPGLDGGELPEWYEPWFQEKCWDWHWAARDFGLTLEEYTRTLKPSEVAVLKAAPPMPEGWMPERERSRRPV